MTASRAAELVADELKRRHVLLEGGHPVSLRVLRLWQTQARKSPGTKCGMAYKAVMDANFSSDNFEELKVELLDMVGSHAAKFRVGDY